MVVGLEVEAGLVMVLDLEAPVTGSPTCIEFAVVLLGDDSVVLGLESSVAVIPNALSIALSIGSKIPWRRSSIPPPGL